MKKIIFLDFDGVLNMNIIKDYYNSKANSREMSMGQSSLLVQLSNSNESLKIQLLKLLFRHRGNLLVWQSFKNFG